MPIGPANCVGRMLDSIAFRSSFATFRSNWPLLALERSAARDRRVLHEPHVQVRDGLRRGVESHVRVGVDQREQLLVDRARLRVHDRHRPGHDERIRRAGSPASTSARTREIRERRARAECLRIDVIEGHERALAAARRRTASPRRARGRSASCRWHRVRRRDFPASPSDARATCTASSFTLPE